MPKIKTTQNEEGWYTTIYYTWKELGISYERILRKFKCVSDTLEDDCGVCLSRQYYGRNFNTVRDFVEPWTKRVQSCLILPGLTKDRILDAIQKHSGIGKCFMNVEEIPSKYIVRFDQGYDHRLETSINTIIEELGISQKDFCKQDNTNGTIRKVTINKRR